MSEERPGVSTSARPGDLSESLQRVCDESVPATNSDTALIFVPDNDVVVCVAAAGQGRSLIGWRVPRRRALARVSHDTRDPLLVHDVTLDRRADGEILGKLGARSFASVPILVGSLVAATLEVHSARPGAYGVETRETLVAMSHRAKRAFRRAIREAGPLTRPRLSELPGAVAYQERLGSIRAEASEASLLIVVVGPPLEAARLHLVRDVLMTQRATDFPFVIDADAFAVVMPDTPREGADIAARRIEKLLRERGLPGMGLGTAVIGPDPAVAHSSALSEAMVRLRQPPPPPPLP